MPRSSIFVGERYLGEIAYPQSSPLHIASHSLAYFCSECGEIWARFVCLREDGTPGRFFAHQGPCESHQDSWSIPGTLLSGAMEQILDRLPPDALRREFTLHLSYYESLK